jgi:transposase InsO family protein
MKQHYPTIGLQRLCRLFGKTRQAYYDHSNRVGSDKMAQEIILELVRQTRKQLPRVGILKLHYMLKEELMLHAISIGRDSFCHLLKENNLQIKRRKMYARTTDSDHRYRRWPDLAAKAKVKAAGELWVSDITYLRTKSGFVYLSLITDAYSKKIVGYHLSQNLKAQNCIIALNKAIAGGQYNTAKLIHHSDRGIQYCCDEYVAKLQSSSIRISMTQSGSPYENAIAERVNGILKNELGLNSVFEGYKTAVAPTHNAINLYNNLRPHMSCGYLTPQQAHDKKEDLKKMWR